MVKNHLLKYLEADEVIFFVLRNLTTYFCVFSTGINKLAKNCSIQYSHTFTVDICLKAMNVLFIMLPKGMFCVTEKAHFKTHILSTCFEKLWLQQVLSQVELYIYNII